LLHWKILVKQQPRGLVKFADTNANNIVLDVACGTGVIALAAARCGASVTGADLSPL
jgi:2-polyprenyl-3-methyl-5-hydroxy-6-metoxy-1,4-benzoquinol methylase